MSHTDPYDRPRAVSGRTQPVNPQDTLPQERVSQPEITTKSGPGKTTNITTKASGMSSFRTASGQIKTPNISRGPGPGSTTGITKSADGKTSFRRV